ncbi:hypothetical protein FKP32DRAFT_1679880 [Trametes sanguinea]|nr:hypothetical protein FKP32DRAFT_1679880 [Trametes sanguinea]
MVNPSFNNSRMCRDAIVSVSDGALQIQFSAVQHYLPGPQSSPDSSSASLALLVQQMNQMCANQQAALEQAQRAHEMMLQQQRMLTAATLRSELRTYNSMSSQWKPLPLPNGNPFPADVRFPRNIRDLKDNEEICALAQLYEIETKETDKRLRDHLAVFIAALRA